MTQSIDLSFLVRPHILNLKPYGSARDEYEGTEGIFLDANENPFGSAGNDFYNRYPDPYQSQLKEKIAQIKGVPSQQLFLGNGSDEAIDLLMRIFCEPKEHNLVIMPPTYGMYEVSANIQAIEIRKASLTPDFEIDLPEIWKNIDNKTRLIFVCSPNNPTGNNLDRKKILELIKNFDGIVIVDEAYIDFSQEDSFVKLLDQYPNLVVLQTLSKAWGLAGLRIGLAFAQNPIIKLLNKIKSPYNISSLSQEVALKNLDENKKNSMVEQLTEQRIFLEKELAKLPTVRKIYPSNANFLLVKMDNAHQVYQKLIQKLIIVRDRSSVRLCEDCLRISVGTPQENVFLLEALRNSY